MIRSLDELFPSSSDEMMRVDFPVYLPRKVEKVKKKEIELAIFFPDLDVTFYPPLSKIFGKETWDLINEAGLDIFDIEIYRIGHEGAHSFLAASGAGVQRILLEDCQVQKFANAIEVASSSITQESSELLIKAGVEIQELKNVEKMLHSRSVELNEAFASFCAILSTDEKKQSIFRKLIEEDLKERDLELAKCGKQGKHLQLWKDLFWIYQNFGLETVINSVKLAFNIPILTSHYVGKFGSFFAGINPRARFDIVHRVLEKYGTKAKKEIAEKAMESSLKIKDEILELQKEKILRLMLEDEEIIWISPSYLAMCNLEKELSLDLPLKAPARPSSMIIKEAPPGYWKEAKKGETKRMLRHPIEGKLVLLKREDVAYTQRISNALETIFLLSALKDQALKNQVGCLKREFERCQTKHVGRTEKGWDKFKELKCTECQAYKVVTSAKKIAQIWSASLSHRDTS